MTTPQSTDSPLADLSAAGVSLWLDDLSRQRLQSGNLADLIAHQAHRRGHHQPVDLPGRADRRRVLPAADRTNSPPAAPTSTTPSGRSPPTTSATPATCSPRSSKRTGHVDGRVSIEVDPRLAHDTAGHHRAGPGTVQDRRPAQRADQDPGHPGRAARDHRGASPRAISVNVTLIFSLDRYQAVMDAYLAGLEQAKEDGHDISQIHSVASFFVSRVDTEIDKRLQGHRLPGGRRRCAGEAAIANARLAYQAYEQTFTGDRWDALAADGRQQAAPAVGVHRGQGPRRTTTPVTSSNSSPPNTVNTAPEKTIDAVARPRRHPRQHHRGHLRPGVSAVFSALEALGIDLDRRLRRPGNRRRREIRASPGTNCSSRSASELARSTSRPADAGIGDPATAGRREGRGPTEGHRR